MPATWTDAMERQLLLAVIASCPTPTPDWDMVAEQMGNGQTASAVRQKFNKLKRATKEELGEDAVATPKGKGGKAANGTTKGAGKKGGAGKRKVKDEAEDGGDDEEAEEESPKKKLKVKDEVVEDGDELAAEDEF